jgi:purine-binding chemotaxis protein CheW
VIGTALALDKAAELRATFDRTYAVSPCSQTLERIEDLLSIRLDGNPYALRTAELSAFTRAPRIVAVPSPIPELLGLCGIRGGVVPVYSLSALFSHRREDQERWCVLCGSEEPVAFAFSDFEGYVRAVQSQVYAARHEDGTSEHVTQVIRINEIIRPIVSLPSIVDLIKKRCGKKHPMMEES